MKRPPLLATADGSGSLLLAAPGAAGVDQARRMISGLAVPFGPIGQTSAGRLTFQAGALGWTVAARVKLLREHAQADPVGVTATLEEIDAVEVDRRLAALGQDPVGLPGLWATFRVPEGDNGDRALAEAANGLRDGLSVGVQLDEATLTRMRRAQGGAVPGTGALREISLVSVPAWDDARVGDVAASADQLVVSAWAGVPLPGGSVMHCQLCGHSHAPGTPCLTVATVPPTHVPTPQPPTVPAPVPNPTPPDPATPPAPDPATPPAPDPATPPAPPATVHAAAGAAVTVGGEPATYTFAVDGHSLVYDAWHGRIDGDGEAVQRVARFNAELAAGNPASVMALAAVLTRDAVDQVGPFVPQGYRPDLMVRVIDAGRPIVARLNRVPIGNATPFLVPVEGEFDGVDDHVEGTAHVDEGTLDLGEATVRPRAVSGAFRVSREMVDSSNPAIDRVAISAMLRDYRRKTEDKVVAALIAADAGPDLSVNTVMELRAILVDFMPDDDMPADFIAAGRTLYAVLMADIDGTGRPMIPSYGPSNAPAIASPSGRPGVNIDGTDVFRAARMTPATDGFIVRADDVLWAESNVQQFRFDEVEGPGIIKLALWAYSVAQVMRASSVRRIRSAAA